MANDQENFHHDESQNFIGIREISVLICLIHAVTTASGFIIMRKIGTRAHPVQILSSFALFCTLFSPLSLLIPNLNQQNWILPQSFHSIFWLIIIALCNYWGQIWMAQALEWDTAVKVSTFNFMQVAIAFLLEWILTGGVPSWSSLIGTSLIGSAIIVIGLLKWNTNRYIERKKMTADL